MRRSIFGVFITLLTTAVWAQGTFTLKGKVYDFKTRTELPGAIVQLMHIDSTKITATTAISRRHNDGQTDETSDFSLTMPRQEGTYIIRCSLLGYKTIDMTVTLANLKKREFSRELPPFLMREDSKILNELTVSATKVQFYYRGDTIIYNANAFVLAEGSMLDALVRQLPGMEIRPNGDIYHNGRLVQNLMLNGKDFFKSDKRVMLDNLPTYMVKQIEVYDKVGNRSEFLGADLPNDKEYVMDVKLKKEYSVGWIANTEAGVGIAEKKYKGDNPYLARLFAMRFTDHSQLAFYANTNNLSDKRRPGGNDGFKPENLSAGTLVQRLAGVTYGVDARNKKWKLGGDASFSHSILRGRQTTDRTNFLTSGDTYDRIENSDRDKNLNISTDNRLEYRFKQVQLSLRHSLLYHKFDMTNDLESTTRSDTLINRYYTHGLTRGHDIKTGIKANSLIKFKDNTIDHIEAGVSFLYSKRTDDTFKRYNLYLGSASKPTRYADQYYRNHPDDNFAIETSVAYNRRISKPVHFVLQYDFMHTQANRNSRLYQLDMLTNYEEGEMGILPSIAEYEATQDLRNSYESHPSSNEHTLMPGLYFSQSTRRGTWSGQFYLPVSLRHDQLDYMRGYIDTTLTRKTILVGRRRQNTQLIWVSKDNTRRFDIKYWTDPNSPDLLNMVNMRDETDPLNIREGNARLKNSYNHRANIKYSLRKNNANFSWLLETGFTDNAIAMGYSYNPTTGVRTYRAQNVDGNWNIAFQNGFILKKKRLTFSSLLNVSHLQNVDLVGEEDNNKMNRSTVKSESVGTKISTNYMFGKHNVGAKFNGTWRFVNSLREDFTNLNIWDYNYGLTATFQLPYHFQFTTDLTMFSRRGYYAASLNTDDLVWNARLSYSAMRGNLLFILDGFDLLGQLSNVTYNLNGQGRTEIRRNVLPQYALFHVQYRLNKQPKKK